MDDLKIDYDDEKLASLISNKVSDFKEAKQKEYLSTAIKYERKFGEGGIAKTYLLKDKNYTPKGVLKTSKRNHHTLQREAETTDRIGTLGAQKRELRRAKKGYNFDDLFGVRLSAPQVFQKSNRFEMEFIEKGDLSSSPKTLDIYDILKQILKLVNDMHADDYIHRDIKPRNLLLGKDDKIRLADLDSVLQIRKFNPKYVYLTHEFADFEAHTTKLGNKFKIDIYSIAVTAINYLLGDETFYNNIFSLTYSCKSKDIISREFKKKYIEMAKEFEDKDLGDMLCKMLKGKYDSIKDVLYDFDKIITVIDKKDFKIALSFFTDEKLQDILIQLEKESINLNFIIDNPLLYDLFNLSSLQNQLDAKNLELANLLTDCSEELEEQQKSHVLKLAEKFQNNTFTKSCFKISKQSIKKQKEKNQYSF